MIFSSQPAALFSNSPFLENMDVGAAAKARGPTRGSGCMRKARAYSDTTNGEKLLENKEVFFRYVRLKECLKAIILVVDPKLLVDYVPRHSSKTLTNSRHGFSAGG